MQQRCRSLYSQPFDTYVIPCFTICDNNLKPGFDIKLNIIVVHLPFNAVLCLLHYNHHSVYYAFLFKVTQSHRAPLES